MVDCVVEVRVTDEKLNASPPREIRPINMRLDPSTSRGRRWRGRLVWLLLLSASVPGAAAASACKASDPSLGLTK